MFHRFAFHGYIYARGYEAPTPGRNEANPDHASIGAPRFSGELS